MWKPLHDLNWSLHQGRLHELFFKDSLTLATWGLTVATFLLVLDSWRKSKEQRERWFREDEQHEQDRDEERERWRRDDEIREQALRPRFDFGLSLVPRPGSNRNEVVLWCANLGSVSFLVERIFAQRSIDLEDEIAKHFDPRILVKPGEMGRTAMPASIFDDVFGKADKKLWIIITSPSLDMPIESPIKIFSFFAADRGQIDTVSEGFHELKKVKCKKCDSTGFLSATGVLEISVLREMMQTAERDLAATCPEHQSNLLKLLIDTNGISRSLNTDAGRK